MFSIDLLEHIYSNYLLKHIYRISCELPIPWKWENMQKIALKIVPVYLKKYGIHLLCVNTFLPPSVFVEIWDSLGTKTETEWEAKSIGPTKWKAIILLLSRPLIHAVLAAYVFVWRICLKIYFIKLEYYIYKQSF